MSGNVKLITPSNGSVTLSTPDTASAVTVTIPAATDTVTLNTQTQTLTNKTLTAAGVNTVEATSGPTSTQLSGNRNKIINGAMMIDQRNAGASVTNIGGVVQYTVDRWYQYSTQNSKFTIQQNAGAVTPPAGFTNYLGVTSSSAYSPVSGDLFVLPQWVEGYNISDLAFGTASAKAFTLSFWVRSSLTGTFYGYLTNGAQDRRYIFSYSISIANTWTYVTISLTADTTGTWNSTNGGGLQVGFTLAAGSTYISSTIGSWTGTTGFAASGYTNVLGTNGATFYITGIQLEKGATATPFENRLYGTELALCQRYYETGASKLYIQGGSGITFNTSYHVSKRASPTVSTGSSPYGGTVAPTSIEYSGLDNFWSYKSSGGEATFSWTSSAEL